MEKGARENARPPAGAGRGAAFAFYRRLRGITGDDSLLRGNFFRLESRQGHRSHFLGYSRLFPAILAYSRKKGGKILAEGECELRRMARSPRYFCHPLLIAPSASRQRHCPATGARLCRFSDQPQHMENIHGSEPFPVIRFCVAAAADPATWDTAAFREQCGETHARDSSFKFSFCPCGAAVSFCALAAENCWRCRLFSWPRKKKSPCAWNTRSRCAAG